MFDIIIRAAAIPDYDRICELAAQMDRLHLTVLPDRFRKPAGPNRARTYVEALIADPNTYLAVAEAGDRVVALLNSGLGQTPDVPVKPPRRFLKIRGLVVDEAHRRRGIGRALFAAAMEWAGARGAQEVQLNVYEVNPVGAAFCRAAGFAPLSRRYVRPLDG